VENAYLEEKEEACLALRELALQARYVDVWFRFLPCIWFINFFCILP
jgi:hypothetical protein